MKTLLTVSFLSVSTSHILSLLLRCALFHWHLYCFMTRQISQGALARHQQCVALSQYGSSYGSWDQTLHMSYSSSPVWILLCTLRCDLNWKCFPRSEHSCVRHGDVLCSRHESLPACCALILPFPSVIHLMPLEARQDIKHFSSPGTVTLCFYKWRLMFNEAWFNLEDLPKGTAVILISH